MFRPCIPVCVCLSLIAWPTVAHSQPHHHHDTGGYGYVVQPEHHDHVLIDPHGHVVTQHHDTYRYVIPASRPTLGTYYTFQNTRYYTPPVRVVQGQTAYAPPTQVTFGGFSHVDDLTSRIETAANELCLDLHYNYQHNHGFAETYGEAYSLLQQAKALHAAEHSQDRNFIRATVQSVDGLFHHVEGDATQFAPHLVRPIGAYSLRDKLAQLESMIHHLMHDVGIQPHAQGAEQAPPPGGGVEQAPPPPGFRTNTGFPPSAPAFNQQPGVFLNTAPPATIPAPRP